MPTGADCKWRFMWRIGPRPDPSATDYPELNAAPVVPAAFPEWPTVMNGWGNKMLAAVEVRRGQKKGGGPSRPTHVLCFIPCFTRTLCLQTLCTTTTAWIIVTLCHHSSTGCAGLSVIDMMTTYCVCACTCASCTLSTVLSNHRQLQSWWQLALTSHLTHSPAAWSMALTCLLPLAPTCSAMGSLAQSLLGITLI